MFIPIAKVDEAQRLVYGVLTAEVADKSGEILDYATAKPAFEKWSNEISEATGGKSKGNVRAMHGSIAAGKFTDIQYDDAAKRIEGCAKIVDDTEWNKVLEGVYTGFSIGGGYAKRWTDPNNPKLKRYTPVLSEVSIVDNPCVASATFEYIKADGSREMRKFTPSNEDSMTTATTGGAAADNTADDAALLKSALEAEAAGTASDEQKALLAKAAADSVALVKDGKAVKPKSAPVQKWLAEDGTPFDSKREAEIHNLGLEKQAELAPALSQMDELLKGAKKPAADEEEDEDEEGDDEDTKKTKKARRDEKAAKGKEKAEKDDDMGMAAKAAGTGDVSATDAKADAELSKSDGDVADKPVDEPKTDKPAHDMAKSGARHSKADMDRFADMHKMMKDHADAMAKMADDHCEAMGKCMKEAGMIPDKSDDEDDMEPSGKNAKKMSKLYEQLNAKTDEVLAVSKVAASSNETLLKAIPLIEGLQKQVGELQQEKSDLVKRMEHLEKQPAAPKGHVRAVSKTQDGGASGETEAEYKVRLAKMNPAEKSRELMKLAMSNPQELPHL